MMGMSNQHILCHSKCNDQSGPILGPRAAVYQCLDRVLGNTNSDALISLKADDCTCWHALFSSTLVACGFPMIARNGVVKGLEVPLDMMTALAEANYATHYDQTLLLKGFSTMLVPTQLTEQSVVWHFSTIQEKRIDYCTYRECCDKCIDKYVLNIYRLQDLDFRNFVGWAPCVTRHLGT